MKCTAQDRGGGVPLDTQLLFQELRRVYASLLHYHGIKEAIVVIAHISTDYVLHRVLTHAIVEQRAELYPELGTNTLATLHLLISRHEGPCTQLAKPCDRNLDPMTKA